VVWLDLISAVLLGGSHASTVHVKAVPGCQLFHSALGVNAGKDKNHIEYFQQCLIFFGRRVVVVVVVVVGGWFQKNEGLSYSIVLLPSLSISPKNRWYFSREPSSCLTCVGSPVQIKSSELIHPMNPFSSALWAIARKIVTVPTFSRITGSVMVDTKQISNPWMFSKPLDEFGMCDATVTVFILPD
jgi:hypothetical protein